MEGLMQKLRDCVRVGFGKETKNKTKPAAMGKRFSNFVTATDRFQHQIEKTPLSEQWEEVKLAACLVYLKLCFKFHPTFSQTVWV